MSDLPEIAQHVHRCFDCGTELTPQTQPYGVIYVRAYVDGRWVDIMVCEADWQRREQRRAPVRFPW